MDLILARNVEEALILGVHTIQEHGVKRDSRNGPVRVMGSPFTTVYNKPMERVLFIPERDANPYFHFMECLWMMAGRRDVDWISQFNSGMVNYSDDGINFHGAYGYRWRNHFGDTEQSVEALDQLATIANLLIINPDDRRCVLQMWDASVDLGFGGKDFPCNLSITFRVNPEGHLDMTVFNRSNDMIWGAYGANAVHMSFLQEVMAAWIGKPVGRYWQISTNFHAYEKVLDGMLSIGELSPGFTDYELEKVKPFPIVNIPIEQWFNELDMFMSEGPVMGFRDPFFKNVAGPMMLSWAFWKDRDIKSAKRLASSIKATDWRKACLEWLERRS